MQFLCRPIGCKLCSSVLSQCCRPFVSSTTLLRTHARWRGPCGQRCAVHALDRAPGRLPLFSIRVMVGQYVFHMHDLGPGPFPSPGASPLLCLPISNWSRTFLLAPRFVFFGSHVDTFLCLVLCPPTAAVHGTIPYPSSKWDCPPCVHATTEWASFGFGALILAQFGAARSHDSPF